MTAKIKHDVSGTAFVVNYSRSKRVNISKDIYADLWVTHEAKSLWNNLAINVYPNDDLNISLRNRFYLEHLKKFIDENTDPVFVGIAAGFDNYPFLVGDNCTFIELDLPNIIKFKKNSVTRWMKEKKLPSRNITYLPIDLNQQEQRLILKEKLSQLIAGRPSFVMMEGVTYYLKIDVLTDIFRILKEVQCKDSITIFDYWKPDALKYPVMMKLKEHLDKEFGYQDDVWNLFDSLYIQKIKGFAEIEATNIADLELKYSETRLFQERKNKIPVFFSVLKRF
jgi:O-methyltransferase involved in polyketide biosynthesis